MTATLALSFWMLLGPGTVVRAYPVTAIAVEGIPVKFNAHDPCLLLVLGPCDRRYAWRPDCVEVKRLDRSVWRHEDAYPGRFIYPLAGKESYPAIRPQDVVRWNPRGWGPDS